MAAAGSWPSIQRNGLLSTKALVALWQVAPPGVRESLISQRRAETRVIHNTTLGSASIRDQKPLHEPSLALALTDMSPHEWYVALNSRVFFFLQRERLLGLLNARSYRNEEHVVITVDTASLVGAHGMDIELCAINSGFAQPHSHAARGSSTFKKIADYPHRPRLVPRSKPPWDVSELAVPEGVLDVAQHVTRVDRMKRSVVIERIQ